MPKAHWNKSGKRRLLDGRRLEPVFLTVWMKETKTIIRKMIFLLENLSLDSQTYRSCGNTANVQELWVLLNCSQNKNLRKMASEILKILFDSSGDIHLDHFIHLY